MPGHTNAALASYAELNCDGVAPPLYTGTEVGFSSLCVRKDVTYDFVRRRARASWPRSPPGRYLHIGGDEAHSTSHADYVAFMNRVQPIVAQVRQDGRSAGTSSTGATPATGAVAQYWGTDRTPPTQSRSRRPRRRAPSSMLSPANRAYLDMKYDEDTPLGLDWAGYVEAQQSYDWDPGSYLTGAPGDRRPRRRGAAVVGDARTNSRHIEYMAFPRLPGIAELGWSPASTHNWDTYRVRLARRGRAGSSGDRLLALAAGALAGWRRGALTRGPSCRPPRGQPTRRPAR